MDDKKKRMIRNGSLVVLFLSLGIIIGVSVFKGGASNEVTKLITQALRYTKLGEYDRSLNKLDEAELKDPTQEQQNIIDQLREIVVILKKSPDKKDLFNKQINRLDKKVAVLSGDKDDKDNKGLSEKERREREELIAKRKELEREKELERKKELKELKEIEERKKEALDKERKALDEMRKKQKEIEKIKKELAKEKSKVKEKERREKLKALEEEKKKLQK